MLLYFKLLFLLGDIYKKILRWNYKHFFLQHNFSIISISPSNGFLNNVATTASPPLFLRLLKLMRFQKFILGKTQKPRERKTQTMRESSLHFGVLFPRWVRFEGCIASRTFQISLQRFICPVLPGDHHPFRLLDDDTLGLFFDFKTLSQRHRIWQWFTENFLVREFGLSF